MLTLYIIPCDNPKLHKPEKAIESFGGIVRVYCKMTHRNILLEKQMNPIVTDWYGYIFSDEMIDERAKEALPIYLERERFDSLIVMKKELINGNTKITQAPRIFHRTITLKDNTFLPENPDACRFERMLDGWILPND